MLRKKFDLVISLGDNCNCASYLKKYQLRDYSYPFDWLYCSTFEKKIDIIVNDFDGFLLKENMRQFTDKDRHVSSHYDYYEDINTGLRFLHDFPKGIQFDRSYAEVNAKYQRRIARLYARGAHAREILFVWFSLQTVLSPETILAAQRSLSQKFKKDVNLLIFENDSNLEDIQEETYGSCVTKVKGRFDTGKSIDYSKKTLADSVFSRINGQKKYTAMILSSLLRFCCCFIPNKELRRKIRNTY